MSGSQLRWSFNYQPSEIAASGTIYRQSAIKYPPIFKKVHSPSALTHPPSARSRVLITGISGFVGQKLAARSLEAGHSVIGVDLRAGDFDFARHPDFQFCTADLTDAVSARDLPLDDLDILYHLAAAGVKAATRHWPLCLRVNVMGTANLMQALIQRVHQGQSVPRIIYTKSYYEDHIETIPAFQENPYVLSKVAATRWIEALSVVYPQSITIAKVFQVYGPGDDPNNVLSYAARTLKAGEKATFGSGNSLRDWIYIEDFIQGLIACGADYGQGLHRFDLGSGERQSIREMVEQIAEICGADGTLLEFDPSRDRGDTEIEDWAKDLPVAFNLGHSPTQGLRALLEAS